MIATQRVDYLTDVDKALLRAILYFDIFDYPITAQEALAYSSVLVEQNPEAVLQNLVAEKIIFCHGGFYSVHNNPELMERRKKGNELAEEKMKTAQKYSRLIASFPFVRAVLLSGSISKGFMDHRSDIDYFIITEAKRVWIVRATLAVFRRLFLFNSHQNFCTNYFIDTESLNIPDQNIFTAIELCTLKPMFGFNVIDNFFDANRWTFGFLPQKKFSPRFVSTRTTAKINSSRSLDRFNRWLMEKSIRYWRKKYTSTVDSPDFKIAFRSNEGVSKAHPRFFQKRALEKFEQKIRAFEALHNIDLKLESA